MYICYIDYFGFQLRLLTDFFVGIQKWIRGRVGLFFVFELATCNERNEKLFAFLKFSKVMKKCI